MRIACPTCNAAYQVPDESLSVGRVVRCARCGTDWAPIETVPDSEVTPEPPPKPPSDPEPVIEAPPVEPVAAPAPAARMMIEDDAPGMAAIPPPEAVAPAPRRGSPLLPIAWVVSLAIVFGALAYLVVERDRIMTVWPPSTRAYAALKLTAGAPSPAPASAEKAPAHH